MSSLCVFTSCVFTTHAETHSQPTTNYTDITVTAGTGIISNFELSKHVLKMLIVVVVHLVIAISYVETKQFLLTGMIMRLIDHSTFTATLTN